MAIEHSSNGLIGAAIRRVEDPMLLAGKGCFVDDINLPGMLHMVVLRSPYAHAKIRSIDTTAAKAIKGVVTVVTGAELPERLNINAPVAFSGQKIPPHPVLARGAVHAPGTPVPSTSNTIHYLQYKTPKPRSSPARRWHVKS